jgi:hypothetical protein
MTRGVLLFAHNNEQVDYGLMSCWCAMRISQYLKVPVSLVTDSNTARLLDQTNANWRRFFDQIILQDSLATQTKRYGDPSNQLTFHNLDRIDAYDLSPYDETILMDTDIVIQTDTLSKLWNSTEDYIVCDRSTDLYGQTNPEFLWVSDYSIKFYWATLFYFKKSQASKIFFNTCKWVKKNYNWLSYVYELPVGPVRNDYVWSIALHTLGHPAQSIPYNLLHSNFEDRVLDMSSSAVRFLTPNGLCKVEQDVHVFNKFDLLKHINEEMKQHD